MRERISRSARQIRLGCFGSLFLTAFLAAIPTAARAQGTSARAAIVALPHDSASGTNDLYTLDLGTGSLTQVDRLRRDPLTIRAQRVPQNLFQEIGRPLSQPAAVGEILLTPIRSSDLNARATLFVETSTGFVAFFDQLGKNNLFGRISTAIGRPFGPIAAADRNFALLMRHNGSGRAEGAYLYHAGSGRGLYVNGVAKLEIDAAVSRVSGWPKLSGRICAAELQSGKRTTGYLVADAADGSLRFLDLADDVARLAVRDCPVDLFPTFTSEAANPSAERFVAAPVRNIGETTTHVLFVDVASGELAILEGVDDGDTKPALRKLAANLYGALGTAAAAGPRNVAVVPARTGTGMTTGIWLIDSLTRAVAYVENPQTPESTTVTRVTVGN